MARRSGRLGRARVLFLAPREPFSLSLETEAADCILMLTSLMYFKYIGLPVYSTPLHFALHFIFVNSFFFCLWETLVFVKLFASSGKEVEAYEKNNNNLFKTEASPRSPSARHVIKKKKFGRFRDTATPGFLDFLLAQTSCLNALFTDPSHGGYCGR